MRYQEMYDALHRQPFQPFRIQLTNGESRVIRHPDFAGLLRTSLLLFESSEADEIPDRFDQYDLLHVVAIKPLNGANKRSGHRKRGKGS